MSILDDIYRRRREACSGRIRTAPGCWMFALTEADVKRTLASGNPHIHEGVDATGQKIYLVKKQSVFCPNPAIGEGKYPKSTERDVWFIPWSQCRKCEHYRKSTRKRRYAACDWIRQRRGGDAGAAKETAQVFADAVKLADEIIGR